ncbi:NDR1/HIN1-like protein 10 [Cynara cardunculus var. scolymus]|uniref:Late embryogenesis abundant protein, LEA-14 n=1 Tax=Cynara cardunculus var. scolymus TaxID=59895 RepID=A0A118K4T6_CYNCS|nr:NDR1/HIN1-like protein 10 [Cynara cardunculus var. scolymus]XP_024983850.1 NDR1/HIN1-like protein 10 [Cynara cardunculus var. scolymus]XP_024983860.1 NDR1/HIN1-like protein 10 [Cynara cardunculus var. scolymus]KVI08056.1 Late embryogenesis abundant protein, LEA-14 [Cynara cardunculus var. scolymus]
MADQSRPVTGYPAPPASNGYPTTAPTAYPYVAQPRPNQGSYFNVSGPYYSDPYATQQRATFIRRIFAIIIACVIIIGTIVFIMWLVLRPQVPQFRVDSLTLSNFNLSSNSLISGNWDARLTVRNPNSKIVLYYDHIEAAVFYKSESISETTVPPFVQGKKNETAVRATFASLSAYVEDRNGINDERARGTVYFNLRMVARVRFKAGAWWARRRILKIYCPSLPVGVSANSSAGSLDGGSKNCRVGL